MRTLHCTLLLWAMPLLVLAQTKWEWSFWGGGANYVGDLVETQLPQWSQTGPALGIYNSYYFGYRWAWRNGLAFGQISGDDINFKDPLFVASRNLRFTAQIAEYSSTLLWEPLGKRRYPGGGRHRHILSPYAFGGVGVAYIYSKPDYSKAPREGIIQLVEQDKNESLDPVQLVIPFGMGLKVDFSKKTSLAIEAGWRKTLTDHIDGVSASGNAQSPDWYIFGGVSLCLRFGERDLDRDLIADKDDACPRVAGNPSAQGCPDSDGDGVEDLEDSCPDEFGVSILSGCPDADGDGLADYLDACPQAPGPGKLKGCPDTDGDGLVDHLDACPNVSGVLWLKGCPDPDYDADGIPDRRDACPDVPGWADCNGCPFFDADGDATADVDDRCPDIAGLPANKGCPDTDKDGIVDLDDKCPELAGISPNGGCPAMEESVKKLLSLAMRNVQFETGSAVLKKSSYTTLDKVVEVLNTYTYYNASIEGHTDSRGKDQSNLILSEKRAKTCLKYLTKKGIPVSRLGSKGFGEKNPVASNKTEKGRKLNRRVEFRLFVP